MDRISAIAASGIVALGLGAGGYLWRADQANNNCSVGQVAGEALIGGPFSLIDHTGTRVSETDVLTEPSLVYFGYTHCPDVCPFDVSRNVEAVELLEERGISATPVFITIDPERDTVDSLAVYAEAMHPKFIALTGNDKEIAAAAGEYRAIYQRQDTDSEYYLVDHSTFTYLMDETGFRGFFRRNLTAEDIAEEVACLVG